MSTPTPGKIILPKPDNVDRRGFLSCMAWVGTGVVWAMTGGVLTSCTTTPDGSTPASLANADFTFAQISDSHIGFSKDPNKDVTGTLAEAVRRLDALTAPPAFILHTGDLTHLSKPDEFDAVEQLSSAGRTKQIYYVPGEHDVFTDSGAAYKARHGKNTLGDGWYSFNYKGAHFVALVNVMDLKAGGLGQLGNDQLDWLQKDLAPISASTPIVVFAHVPLWTVYEPWGWGTEDSAQALTLLRRFGSVTVLNGHIHQVLQKVEGNITFHSARSTAFPQPAPGTAESPGPMKNVAADQLRKLLGLTTVQVKQTPGPLAIIDTTLA